MFILWFNYSLTHVFFPLLLCFCSVMCAFSLTHHLLHVWSVNLQMPMSERMRRILINLKRHKSQSQKDSRVQILDSQRGHGSKEVMLEEPEQVDKACQLLTFTA